jgi:hypothetical protein
MGVRGKLEVMAKEKGVKVSALLGGGGLILRLD